MTAELAGDDRSTRRPSPYVGLPGRQLPPLTAAARDCLGRLPARRRVGAVEGLPLWLPRLGVTVLPHCLVGHGWLCTVVAADAQPSRLPSGVFVVGDVEIRTAIAAGSGLQAAWSVQVGLSDEEFRDAWLVRLAAVDPRYRTVAALLHGLDPETLTVTADDAVRRRSGYRTVSAFHTALTRLCVTGFLMALDDPTTEGARFGLRLPRPGWPQ